MKNRIVSLGIFATIFLLAGIIHSDNKKSTSPYADLYSQKCKSCHGLDGTGVEKMATMLKLEKEKLDLSPISKKSDEDLIKITAEGEGKMPGYGKKLSEKEIYGLVEYMRELFPQEELNEQEEK